MEQLRDPQSDWTSNVRRSCVVAWRVVWPIFRQTLGWLCILLGIIGLVLPVLQGMIFLVIGIALVGRRHPLIRWSSVSLKLFLRRWAALSTPLVGRLGRIALRAQQEVSRKRRRLHWWHVERRRIKARNRACAKERMTD